MDWIELILRGPCFVPDEINEENKFNKRKTFCMKEDALVQMMIYTYTWKSHHCEMKSVLQSMNGCSDVIFSLIDNIIIDVRNHDFAEFCYDSAN